MDNLFPMAADPLFCWHGFDKSVRSSVCMLRCGWSGEQGTADSENVFVNVVIWMKIKEKMKRKFYLLIIRGHGNPDGYLCHVIDVNCLFWLGYPGDVWYKTDHPIYFVNLWQM